MVNKEDCEGMLVCKILQHTDFTIVCRVCIFSRWLSYDLKSIDDNEFCCREFIQIVGQLIYQTISEFASLYAEVEATTYFIGNSKKTCL